MDLIKEYSLKSPLNEAEIKEITGGKLVSKSRAQKLFEQWADEVKELRESRRENESSTDTRKMVESVRNLASKTFLTEAQLMHIIDKNDHLEFGEINESVLVSLVKRELEGFNGLNESKKLRIGDRLKAGKLNEAKKLRIGDRLKAGKLNEANEVDETEVVDTNKTKGDVNTIIFGQDDRIEIPVGYTHIAVDFDGTVNAYTNRPVLGEEGWEGDGPIRIGRVEWDDYKLQSGSNDINLLRNEKRAKMLGSVVSIHDSVNLGSQLSRANSFLQWNSDYQVADSIVNESHEMPQPQVSHINRFLAVPSHMI